MRNRIRHQLIPLLPSIDERMTDHIITTMNHCAQIDEFLQQLTIQTIARITINNNPLSLDTQKFLQLNPILQQRIILQLLIKARATFIPSQALFAEIIRFLKTGKKRFHAIHPSYNISKQQSSFYIIQQ